MNSFNPRAADHPPLDQLVFLEFGRQRVERLDFSPCLSRYGVDKLPPNPRRLRAMMGSLVCIIHGYDHDARELHCIPEVRRFVREFHRAWPHWLFFFCAQPGVGTFEVFTACCLEQLSVAPRDGAGVTLLESDPDKVTHFLRGDLRVFHGMCDQAEVFPEVRQRRLKEVFDLFGLDLPETNAAEPLARCPALDDK